MAHRSPKYPNISLPDAIERAQQVYLKEHQNPVHPEVVAQHMGYRGLSGASMRSLSALRQYGLLEGRGDESRVSDDAVTIFADAELGSQERAEALQRCLEKPPLFQELKGSFQGVPSQGNLRAFLEKRKFTRKAADKASAIFRESVEFVENKKTDFGSIAAQSGEAAPHAARQPSFSGGSMERAIPEGSKTIGVFDFPGVTVHMTATGKVTKATLERLKKHLELKIEDYDLFESGDDDQVTRED